MISDRVRSAARQVGTTLAAEVSVDEVMLVVAIGLIVAGFWSWWRPGAYLAPAALILWIYLPTRTGFVVAPPDPPHKRNARE